MQPPSFLLVSRRSLAFCLSLFLLIGCLATGVSGFGVLVPLVLGTTRSEGDDRVWSYVFAALVPAFFCVKYKVFKKKLVDLEIKRIKGLERPYVFLFYPPLNLLFLVVMISSVKCIEVFTPPSYYKDLALSSSASAVSPLLGLCSFLVAKEATFWTEGGQDPPLLDEVERDNSMQDVV